MALVSDIIRERSGSDTGKGIFIKRSSTASTHSSLSAAEEGQCREVVDLPNSTELKKTGPRSPAFLSPAETPEDRSVSGDVAGSSPSSTMASRSETPASEAKEMEDPIMGHLKASSLPPEMQPPGGKFVSKMYVTLRSPTKDPIFYTTDGSLPTADSTACRGEVELTSAMANDGAITLQAVVCAPGKAASEVVSGRFTLMLPGALLDAASAAVQQGRSLLDAARRLNLGEALEEEGARQLQQMLKPYLARRRVARRRRAILRVQCWARMVLAERAVREQLRRRREADPGGRQTCLVVRLRLKGEPAETLQANRGGATLCQALSNVLRMGERAWLVLSLKDYRPTATAEDGSVSQVKVSLMAFPTKLRLKQLSVEVKEAIASGRLQAEMEGLGMRCRTSYREPEGHVKPLKTDWRRVQAHNGKTYFWNKRTGETSWRVPDRLANANLEAVPIAGKAAPSRRPPA